MAAIGFFAFTKYKQYAAPVPVRSTLGVIPVDQVKTLDIGNLTAPDLVKKLTGLKQNTPDSTGEVSEISLVTQNSAGETQTVPIDTFLRTIDPLVPATLLRSFHDYVFGWYTQEGKENFLLIKTDYYENAYAGMLRWEKTMTRTFSLLMADLDKHPDTIDTSKRLSSTDGTFIDTVFENKDVRELRDDKNHIVIMYSFIDPETLLIAGNEFTFKEILGRYTTAKLAR